MSIHGDLTVPLHQTCQTLVVKSKKIAKFLGDIGDIKAIVGSKEAHLDLLNHIICLFLPLLLLHALRNIFV